MTENKLRKRGKFEIGHDKNKNLSHIWPKFSSNLYKEESDLFKSHNLLY